MIALSDLVILTVSGALLATGIYRWQSNMHPGAGASAVVVAPAKERPFSNQPVIAAPQVSSLATVASRTQSTSASLEPVTDAATTQIPEPVTASPDLISTGDTTARVEVPAAATPDDTALYGTYTVKAGDSLSLIADNHGTSVATLRRINGIEGSLIFVDQQIRYPLPAN